MEGIWASKLKDRDFLRRNGTPSSACSSRVYDEAIWLVQYIGRSLCFRLVVLKVNVDLSNFLELVALCHLRTMRAQENESQD